MELKRLKYFVTAAHELSFSGAARKLGVSQPTLSRGIKELEAHIGGELFNRSTTEVSLTDAGKVFLPEADEALLTLDQAILSARQKIRGHNIELDVGYLPVLLDPFVGQAIEFFRQTFPNVFIRPHEIATQGQIEGLRGGTLDIASACSYECDNFEQEFDVFDFCTVDMCAIIPASDPLAQREFVRLKELEDRGLITFMSSQFPNCAKATENYFKEQGVRYEPVMQANSLQSMMTSILGGNSFALMTALGKTIAPSCVSFVPLHPEENFKVNFVALVKKDEHRKPVLAFLQECRRIAQTRVPQIITDLGLSTKEEVPSINRTAI